MSAVQSLTVLTRASCEDRGSSGARGQQSHCHLLKRASASQPPALGGCMPNAGTATTTSNSHVEISGLISLQPNPTHTHCTTTDITLPPSLPHSLTHALTHARTHSHTHPPTHTHTHTHTLTHSNTHALTHTHTLTNPLTQSPTHSLTHSQAEQTPQTGRWETTVRGLLPPERGPSRVSEVAN